MVVLKFELIMLVPRRTTALTKFTLEGNRTEMDEEVVTSGMVNNTDKLKASLMVTDGGVVVISEVDIVDVVIMGNVTDAN